MSSPPAPTFAPGDRVVLDLERRATVIGHLLNDPRIVICIEWLCEDDFDLIRVVDPARLSRIEVPTSNGTKS